VHPRLIFVLGFVCACESTQTDPPADPKPDAPERRGEHEVQPPQPPPANPNSCMPPGLETASKIETLPLPPGCQVVATGALLAPTIVRNLDELAAAITCEPGVESLTVDFSKHQLHVANFMLSPAYAGGELFDDGTKITFVQRDRSPCPDDPLPMPIGSSIAYLLPQGAERAYVQLACTLPQKCE
jgi:hypothetical protein